jgi:hypothetical protein
MRPAARLHIVNLHHPETPMNPTASPWKSTAAAGGALLCCAALLAGCGGGGDDDDDAAAGGAGGGGGGGGGSVTVAQADLVISGAAPATLNGTLTKNLATVESNSSNDVLTSFANSGDHCRVGAYLMTHPNGSTYFVELSFRKDTRAIGLVNFGTDAGLAVLARAAGPLPAVAVDIANRRIGFTNLTLTSSGTSLTLNGSLEYPTNVAPDNRAACG